MSVLSKSAERGGCFHTQGATLVRGEEMRNAIDVQRSADREAGNIEDRAHGPESKIGDLDSRMAFDQLVEEQGCDQRAMHDEAGIALSVTGIVAVVMDAVAVEGEGRNT